jgi:hypothetical protein
VTRRIILDDPDLSTTDRIDLETLEESPSWIEETTDVELPPEATALTDAHLDEAARRVFERLRGAGVKARSYAGQLQAEGAQRAKRAKAHSRSEAQASWQVLPIDAKRERRRDLISAKEFDRAMVLLTRGDLDAAFDTFLRLLERQPQSTRLWMFARAIRA